MTGFNFYALYSYDTKRLVEGGRENEDECVQNGHHIYYLYALPHVNSYQQWGLNITLPEYKTVFQIRIRIHTDPHKEMPPGSG